MIRKDSEGGTSRTVLYRSKRRKRKQTTGIRSLERLARRAAEAEDVFSSEYLDRHRRSNRKKRDGWLRDLNRNLYRAAEKGSKKLKVRKLVGL